MSFDSTNNFGDVVVRRDSVAPAPLSFAQELLWLMDRAAPGLAAWNVPRALRLRGTLDVAALQSALDGLVARHESLRTVFAVVDGEPRQVVRPAAPIVLARADVRADPDPEAAVAHRAREHALGPFDLSSDSLLRALLIHVAADDHVLCLNSHHIVSDGWSKSIMFRELTALYRAARTGGDAELPVLPIQFSDYAAWERSARHEAALAEPLAYWREKLAGPLPALDIPGDYRADVVPTFEGARRVALLPLPLVTRMRELARQHDATPYMMLLATYVALLHRYSGQDDIVVGSPIVGRLQSETEDLIGYFANTLVLRTKLDGDPTFAQLIDRVRDTAFGAYENQDVPFEKIVLELQRGRSLSHAPLFQAVLTMEDTVPGALELDGVVVEPIPVAEGATKFDLTMLVAEQADGLRLALWYRTDRFAAATVDRMLAAFRELLEAMVSNPAQRVSEARVVGSAARAELIALGAGTSSDPDATVLERFDAIAAQRPSAVAVRSGEVALTYGMVAERARVVAKRLSTSGVRHGDTVAILLDRSPDVLIAVLGCWYAGAAYLPIASDTPAARIASYIDGARATAAITSGELVTRLPESLSVVRLDDPTLPDEPDARLAAPSVDRLAPAYVLFTSGSTGTPKGVSVSHGNLAHYVSAIIDRLALAESESATFASVSPLGADLGNTSIFPALATGGVIDLVPDDIARDPVRFPGYVAAHGIDVLKITPGHLQALLSGVAAAETASVLPNRWLVLGGEALGWELAQRLVAAAKCRVLNHYGPTEATVGACTFEVTADAVASLHRDVVTVPIGRPLPRTTCYVLDRQRRLVPRGAVGELFIGGAGVAHGYVAQPALTAERFVEDPFSNMAGARMYATGDRVRWLGTADALEFLGRADDQIKVRGFRVELAEVEHVLASHPAVGACAVIARMSAPGAADQLVAFVAPQRATGYAAAHAGTRADSHIDTLPTWLRERLPEYMVPDRIVPRESLPLGANGKVDRRALAALELATENGADTDAFVPPAGETEQAIAQIWQEVLQRDRIGASESFLELGGHSLLAIRVLGKLSKRFGVRLPLRTLFDAPTIRALGGVVDAELSEIERRELESVLATIEGAEGAERASGASGLECRTESGTT